MTNKHPHAESGVVPNLLENARVVLINTSHGGNIGGVARAMKNMGLSQLYLVQPRQFPHDEATWRAAGATDVLERAVVVDSFDKAIADCGLVVGASARGRRISWPLVNPRVCAETVYPELRRYPVALVFGREDRGMTNEELQRCNLHVNIPASEEYSSLNLAMAVQVVLYELRMAHLSGVLSEDAMQDWDVELARAEEVENMLVHMEQALADIGFLKPAAPKQLMTRLRRMFGRLRMDTMEVQIMRGLLASAQKWAGIARESGTLSSDSADEGNSH